MNEAEEKVLGYLASRYGDFGFCDFATISRDTKTDRKVVRRACRSLKRKGLTEFARGLWDEDGIPAGSGYAATRSGLETARTNSLLTDFDE